ncbi:MAG: electron transport complex subunit RsxG [Gammaproteobacteria bacterium]|uniref:Ion-translocating oxidoreductase complex subunit G n=1 Tax=Marinobacter nitratireducens TaxID=1137280 RepID=A0A072N723_9GAMM|nr:electron transport complex subunit RsxG [Marinobacter nitratireducens]KEF32768.1 Electron transport complex protein RnfG [Marinobacter nitratireducens]TNE72742.1 MAG: electron transport complex subunit RsxG [Gammaproteobacteria bacterium]TNE97104.1 MAG: electron transport complex subunit RsxG [Gammaproteobacteria bacterium]
MAALAQSIRRSAIGLGLFAVITGGTIAVTQAFTAQRIQEQAARAEAKALFEIIPESTHDNDMLHDTVELPASEHLAQDGPLTVWVARKDGSPTGMIMPVIAPDGYSGNIRLLVGVNLQGTVLGVRVTSHKETPGLGDRIETRKSDWIQSFEGRSLGKPPHSEWNVKKNGGMFDQFTGATITPRAVVKAVQKALIYFRKNHRVILERLGAPAGPGKHKLKPDAIAGETNTLEHS